MSDVAVITVADFMLARIAEDYAAADLVLRPYGDQAATNDAAWWPNPREWDKCLSSDETPLVTRYTPQRVLAECEAKRRIVEWVANAQRYAAEGQPGAFDPEDARALTHALRLLALPYSYHPDYREEWRPAS